MIKKASCDVCKEFEYKYRCPQCRIVYCSLDCYKTHKDTCLPINTQKEQEKDESTTNIVSILDDNAPVPEYNLEDDESEDRVSIEQLKALENSKNLADILCNPHLRQMMTSLVHAKNPGSQLDSAMQEPIFTEFADKCLSIIDNEQNNNS